MMVKTMSMKDNTGSFTMMVKTMKMKDNTGVIEQGFQRGKSGDQFPARSNRTARRSCDIFSKVCS